MIRQSTLNKWKTIIDAYPYESLSLRHKIQNTFSKCFQRHLKHKKKPLNKGLFQLLILFELENKFYTVNIFVYVCAVLLQDVTVFAYCIFIL